jgi:hypothetical protein
VTHDNEARPHMALGGSAGQKSVIIRTSELAVRAPPVLGGLGDDYALVGVHMIEYLRSTGSKLNRFPRGP